MEVDKAVLDCGDNSCEFAESKTGMRTNGGCSCLKDLDFARRMAVRRYILGLKAEHDEARAEVERLRAVLKKIIHREHLFARKHVEVLGKIDTGACSGCTAEEALRDRR